MAVNPMQFEPQIVEESSNIILLNSPFYQPIGYTASATTFTHVRLKLWVWTDSLIAPYEDEREPNIILLKRKVNQSDTYVLFELADYVKDLFTPTFVYSSSGIPTISNTTVYFKYEYDIIVNPDEEKNVTAIYIGSSSTFMGTQGWNWDYESATTTYNENALSFGYVSTLPTKSYNPKIRYASFAYDLDNESSANYNITTTSYTPPLNLQKCAKEGWLIAYINKSGLWDYFTLFGKSVITQNIEKEDYTRTTSTPHLFNNSVTHGVKQFNTRVQTSITINTGLISEAEGQYVEEIEYSPVVYLIEFKDTPGAGYYNNFITRPVIVTDTSMVRKTKINDKIKISYNIKMETTTNKIKNIR